MLDSTINRTICQVKTKIGIARASHSSAIRISMSSLPGSYMEQSLALDRIKEYYGYKVEECSNSWLVSWKR